LYLPVHPDQSQNANDGNQDGNRAPLPGGGFDAGKLADIRHFRAPSSVMMAALRPG
jgi:hypothetical protein